MSLRWTSDHGIALYLTVEAGGATFTDSAGVTQDSEAFAGASWVTATEIDLGKLTSYLAIDVKIVRSGALANVLVRAWMRRASAGGVTFGNAPLAMSSTRADGSTIYGLTHTIGTGDSAVRLLTDDVPLGGTLVIQVSNTGTASSSDAVIVAVTTGW